MTERPVRILVVDEDEALTHVVTLALQLEGWHVQVAGSGIEALVASAMFEPDIILLDIDLPDMAGTSVAAQLREQGLTTPVVFLTGRSTHDDRMAAFGAGGDEYVTKPFGLEELVFRLQPIVRRLGLGPHSRTFATLVLDEATSEVWRGDERIVITPLEFEMLRVLMDEPEKAQSLGSIVRKVTARGIRLPRELAQRLLERMRQSLNATGTELLRIVEGEWVLSH